LAKLWPSISALQILRLFMGCRLRHFSRVSWVSSMILFFGAEFTAAQKSILVQFLPPQSQRNRQTVKNIAEFLTSPLNRPF
jgi:hypothetical protein